MSSCCDRKTLIISIGYEAAEETGFVQRAKTLVTHNEYIIIIWSTL